VAPLTGARALDLLARAPATRILVVGDVMLDRYLTGSVERRSPEAPVPVVDVEREWESLGGAGNVAANAAALGSRPELVSVTGSDDAGGRVRALLRAEAISERSLVVDPLRPTTVKTRVLAGGRQKLRVDREARDPLDTGVEDEVRRAVRERAGGVHVLVIQDYDKGVMTPAVVDCCLESSRSAGIPCIVDPKRRNFFRYGGADVLKPNRLELRLALGESVRPASDTWLQRVRGHLGVRHLVVTLGPEGLVVVGETSGSVRVRAEPRDVYDVSGAGDTVTAAMAVVLAAGGTVTEAAWMANRAAQIEVGKPGVATVSAAELRADLIRALDIPLRQAQTNRQT